MSGAADVQKQSVYKALRGMSGREAGAAVDLEDLTPNDFADLAALEQRLLSFQADYERIAKPFEWKFTTSDLHALLARIAVHETDAPITAAA